MSKVLVDPAALEEAAKWLEVHSSSSGSAEAFAAEALREAIAQPAEAEGVEAVEFWVLFDATTPEPYIKKMMPEGFLAFFDHEEDAIRAKSFHPGTDYKRVPYVRQSDHLAALSAVTAERDRLESMLIRTATRHFALQIKDRADDKKLDECLSEGIAMLEAERDQYRAEVDALRKDAERYRWLRDSGGSTFRVLETGALAKGEFYDAAIDAAMAAKEA